MMNKLEGFFYLKELNIPSIPWKAFTGEEVLSQSRLWTVRSAVTKGKDYHLPRLVGAMGAEATAFAKELYHRYKDSGMVIYYPYFIAEKSGTLELNQNYILVEGVKEDLWHLVTEGRPAVSMRFFGENLGDKEVLFGKEDFFTEKEWKEILYHVPAIKRKSKEMMAKGKSILLEWSYAYDVSNRGEKIGERYLVFYEVREINPSFP